MKEQERRDGWMDGWVGGRMNKRKHSTYWQLISFQKKNNMMYVSKNINLVYN